MLENGETGMPPSMVTQFEVHAPQASVQIGRKWNEGSNDETETKTWLGFYEIKSQTWIEQNHVSFFSEVDTPKELSSEANSFFNEVDIEEKPSLEDFVSWFNELDTRERTMLDMTSS